MWLEVTGRFKAWQICVCLAITSSLSDRLAVEILKVKHNEGKWEHHSAKLRDQLGVARDWKPWTSKPTTYLHGLPRTARVLDLLDNAWICTMLKFSETTKTEAELKEDLYADISQGTQYRPWGGLQSLCSSSS